MQQSPCDVTAYHAYNGSEIAPSKMQNIASSITGCLCLRKNMKYIYIYIYMFHTIQTFISLRKQKKNDFYHESPPLRVLELIA